MRRAILSKRGFRRLILTASAAFQVPKRYVALARASIDLCKRSTPVRFPLGLFSVPGSSPTMATVAHATHAMKSSSAREPKRAVSHRPRMAPGKSSAAYAVSIL
jgi:hypothetical protein